MAENSLPFIHSTGLIKKILDKIIEAQTPSRYTQDYQSNMLGYGSGSALAFVPLLKRLGMLNSDGTPTDLYKKFRGDSTRGPAMAEALKIGYAPLFKVSEYVYNHTREKLKEAIIQVTGYDKKSPTVGSIATTFETLKNYAIFEPETKSEFSQMRETSDEINLPKSELPRHELPESPPRGMNLSYTINLNLPETKDPEVFAAIFKSLKEHLLK